MKILCSSDIHSETPTFFSFASRLNKSIYDCGILAGDLIDEYPTASEAIGFGLATQDDFENGYNQKLTLDDLENQIYNVNEMFANKNSMLMKTLERKRDQIIKDLIKTDKPVFMLLGNHDKINWASKENIVA